MTNEQIIAQINELKKDIATWKREIITNDSRLSENYYRNHSNALTTISARFRQIATDQCSLDGHGLLLFSQRYMILGNDAVFTAMINVSYKELASGGFRIADMFYSFR